MSLLVVAFRVLGARHSDVGSASAGSGSRRGGGAGGVLVSIWDQADFVPVIVLLLLPLWGMPLGSVLLAFAVVTAVHLVLNLVGYAIGARTSPI
jgi:hypothetical protein